MAIVRGHADSATAHKHAFWRATALLVLLVDLWEKIVPWLLSRRANYSIAMKGLKPMTHFDLDWDYAHDISEIHWDWKDDQPNRKRAITRGVYDQFYGGALAGARKVFRRDDYRGTSVYDVAQIAIIEYFSSSIVADHPWRLGRTMGTRRALDVVNRTPKALEMSAISSEIPIEAMFESKEISPDFKLLTYELMEGVCGSDFDNDMSILVLRIQNMTFEEIAWNLGMNASTVRSRYYKMVHRYNELYEDELVLA